MADEPLTVGKLKEELEKFPDDVVIFSDGCDCIELAYHVKDLRKSDYYEQGIGIMRAGHG